MGNLHTKLADTFPRDVPRRSVSEKPSDSVREPLVSLHSFATSQSWDKWSKAGLGSRKDSRDGDFKFV